MGASGNQWSSRRSRHRTRYKLPPNVAADAPEFVGPLGEYVPAGKRSRRRESWVHQLVRDHGENLKDLGDHVALHKWSLDQGLDSPADFARFKRALRYIDIEYDAVRSRFHDARASRIAHAQSLAMSMPLNIPPDAVVGYRAFRFDDEQKSLMAGHYDVHYRPRHAFVAACLADVCPHLSDLSAPADACKCGIYVGLSPEPIWASSGLNTTRILARVRAWGKLLPRSNGTVVRAQFCYVECLFAEGAALAKVLGSLYDVPVQPLAMFLPIPPATATTEQ